MCAQLTHPELISGTIVCADCRTAVSGIEQQFKYTQPTICWNPVCHNQPLFVLDPNNSAFVDFEKARIQESRGEFSKCDILRSVEMIVCVEAVEGAQAGDQCDFAGTLIVVPDVSQLATPGIPLAWGNTARGKKQGCWESWEQAILLMPAT